MTEKTLDAGKKNPGKLKKVVNLITGFGLISVLWRSIAGSTKTILRGDDNAVSLQNASKDARAVFASRLRLEGLMFFALAILGAMGGLAGAAGQGAIYMIAGMVALLSGSVIGIIKMWQADVVATGVPVAFLGWIGLSR